MPNLNVNISTVLVGLVYEDISLTLRSILVQPTIPKSIIIVCPKNLNYKIEENFSKVKNLKIVNDKGEGVYFAMNMGLDVVTTKLVHYLNAGDEAFNDIYFNINKPGLLKVRIFDENKKFVADAIPLIGNGSYNHQGVIFPANHRKYDTKYLIAADFKLMLFLFKRKLSISQANNDAYVKYFLGGLSSKSNFQAKIEMIRIGFEYSLFYGLFVTLHIIANILLGRFVRRFILKMVSR